MRIGSNARRDSGHQAKSDWRNRQVIDDDVEIEDEEVTSATFEPQPQQQPQPAQKRWEDQVERPATPDQCASVVGAGTTWQGTLTSDGSVRLDGKVSGEVKAAGTVHITEGAQVNAVVQAKYVVVAGTFDGQLYASSRLELLPSSRVKGSITTPQISVGEGAFIDGEIHMVEESAVSNVKPFSAARASEATDALAKDEAVQAAAQQAVVNPTIQPRQYQRK
ncbi:MAG TPA: polymer-forming cytoskeletal protein [Dehalococcoidia bacterium]|jgi:cytoskeletal protein CcmA (bactofilin family)|nr:polymer-forming cytoskeletal protein [Dehalococcoidia bacterium]